VGAKPETIAPKIAAMKAEMEALKTSGSKLEALNVEPDAKLKQLKQFFDALHAELTANTEAQMGD
jgi:hypothetical protein